MFIHWGIYAASEGSWQRKETKGIGEWIQGRERIPIAEYQELAAEMTLDDFDANEWPVCKNQHKPSGKRLSFNLELAADTIGELYRERWNLEILFRDLKLHFRIKSFVGTNPNAVPIQVWTAVLAVLLIKFMRLMASFNWAASNLIALFRINLLNPSTPKTGEPDAGRIRGMVSKPECFS